MRLRTPRLSWENGVGRRYWLLRPCGPASWQIGLIIVIYFVERGDVFS